MMDTVVSRKLYESMFLVDSAQASDWDGTISLIEGLLKKSDAEIVSIKKWDERRLAYEIERKTRGMYILCYFNADGDKIQDIEKSVQLCEPILRVLILSTEQMTSEDIERDTPATKLAKDEAARQAAIEAKQEEAAAAAAAAAAEAEAAQSGDAEETPAVEGEAGAAADAEAVATEDAGVSEPGDVVAGEVDESGASEASAVAEEADSTEPAEESKESQVDEAGEPSAEAGAEAPEEQDL